MLSRASLAAICVLFTAAAGPQEHRPAPVPPGVTLVSPGSPFDESCNSSQTGTNFHNGAVEPFIAVDPGNPDHLLGVWQQDRWADGGSSGLMSAVSTDRGKTWSASYAHFSTCSGGAAYNRASDAWPAISPGGVAYQIALGLADGNNTSSVMVSRSADGGFTWGDPITLIRDTIDTGFNDKEAITADPYDAHYVYAAWDRSSGNLRPEYFSRTTDGGMTWETAHSIYNPGANVQVTDSQILVLPDGTVVDVILIYRAASTTIDVIRSTDHGATWSAPVMVSLDQSVGTVDAKTQAPLRTGAALPNAAVDAQTGALYIVWTDGRFSGRARDGVALSKSADGGQTWSAPVQVNQVASVQAFTPAVAAANGAVAVTYYDFRMDTPNPSTLMANAWRIVSTDGASTWRESPVFGPFNLNAAPMTVEGAFIGDYEGITAAGEDFLAFFAAANPFDPARPSSIFAAYGERTGDTRWNGHIEVNRHPRAYRPDAPPTPRHRR